MFLDGGTRRVPVLCSRLRTMWVCTGHGTDDAGHCSAQRQGTIRYTLLCAFVSLQNDDESLVEHRNRA